MNLNPYQATEGQASHSQRSASSNVIFAWGCAAACLFILLPLTAVVAFIIGAIAGESGQYHRRAEEQGRQMRTYVEHNEKYSKLTIEEASNGWSYFMGTVNSQADVDALKAEMQRLFGEELGERMTNPIEVFEVPRDLDD